MLSQERLEDYQAQCNVLYHALYFEPGDVLLGQFREAEILESWPQTGEPQNRQQGLEALKQALAQEDEALLSALKLDFSQLFVVPATMKAIPWGSPYLHEKRLLCGPSTVALARFYKANGILVETQHNEPVDHIGLMLSVVGQFLEKVAEQNTSDANKVLELYLAEHLLPWAGRFTELMAEHAQTEYYRAIALLTDSILQGLKQDLAVTPLSLPLYQ